MSAHLGKRQPLPVSDVAEPYVSVTDVKHYIYWPRRFCFCTRGDKEKDRVIAYLDNILKSYELNGRIEWRIGGRVASYLFKSAEMLEFTGALAGYTFALQNTRLVAMTGLITSVAASLSIATSEYLSTKSEGNAKNPLKAAVYTGIAYVLTVIFLISPYLLLTDLYACLSLTIVAAVTVIFLFTFYISLAKDLPFRKRFLEMTAISLGIAGLTFAIGFLIREFLNVKLD